MLLPVTQSGKVEEGMAAWLALPKAFAAGLPSQAGISEEEILICTLFPQICLLL